MRHVQKAPAAVALLIGATLICSTMESAAAGPRRSSSAVQLGELAIHSSLSVRSTSAMCPPEAPPEADECFSRSGGGTVPGLGRVTQTYTFIVDTNSPTCVGGDILLPSRGKLTVSGKGEIAVALAGPSNCYQPAEAVLQAKQPFSITGGTGRYAGATGSGTVQHDTRPDGSGGSSGSDTWEGTVAVPGLVFDLTPPAISGATPKSARARRGKKRMRVRYRVTARDEVDGAVPVTCRPRSGSWFKVGRKTVKCSATDTSGNATTATFTITVRARRR